MSILVRALEPAYQHSEIRIPGTFTAFPAASVDMRLVPAAQGPIITIDMIKPSKMA